MRMPTVTFDNFSHPEAGLLFLIAYATAFQEMFSRARARGQRPYNRAMNYHGRKAAALHVVIADAHPTTPEGTQAKAAYDLLMHERIAAEGRA